LIETEIVMWLQQALAGPAADALASMLSIRGAPAMLSGLCVLPLLLSDRHRRAGILILAAVAAVYLVNELGVKPLLMRPRPFEACPEILLIGSMPSGFSFASTHSAVLFATATAVILTSDRRYGALLFALAVSVAILRVYAGVHYPSDVIAGAAMGVIAAVLLVVAFHPSLRDGGTETA
jgi:undecaprenyl-diphosphatase